MSAHAPLIDLSRYLDGELPGPRERALEGHLASCAGCRDRLAGLRRVVGHLERLDSEAPPQHLGGLVERRIAADASRGRLLERWQRRLEALLEMGALMPALGVVLALAIIVYLLSLGVAQRESGPTVVVIDTLAAPAPGEGAERRVSGRRFTARGGVWVEEGLEAVTPDRRLGAGAELEPELAAALGRLAPLGGMVRFRYGAEVVEAPVPEGEPVSSPPER